MAPHALWSGAIAFGLVNVPVKLYRATASSSDKTASAHQVHKTCGTRLKHKRWCPKEDREVPWNEVARGYEVAKGRYVLVGNDDLEGLPSEDRAAIAIEDFVELGEVDPRYFEDAYWVAPDGPPRAYTLLHRALRDTGRVAVARMMLRTRSHLAVVRPVAEHLLLETMFYAAELVDASQIQGIGERAKVPEREEALARKLIDSMTIAFDPTRYQDVRGAALRRLIESKVAEGESTFSDASESAQAPVVDLMEALKRSLASSAKPEPKPTPTRSATTHRRRTERPHRRKAS